MAFECGQPSLSLGIPVRFNGVPHRVFLQVKPVSSEQVNPQQAVVFFIEGDAITETESDASPSVRDQTADAVIRGLKEELELTRARLRASREEYEAANEELRAANEELQSINEEYRSTAEELETSKEELQSMNEELQTVNAELKIKLDGVSRTNNDLQNFMAATDIGTLFLDSRLHIERFTPRITELFNITVPDEGRPITDFTNRLDYPNFSEDAKNVLRDLNIVEREIGGNGRWFQTRLRPYRTLDDRIDGIVCTFVDVTDRVTIREALNVNETRLRLLLGELSHRMKNTLAVVQSIARQTFGRDLPREEAVEIFSSRLRALSEAHSLLVRSDWRGADFRELAVRQIDPYAQIDGRRVTLSGPAVNMPPDVATPLALVLHELATNALKFGVLSEPDGTLRIDWGFRVNGGNREFRYIWLESGGPKVKPPSREGFGSWLIQNGLPGANIELTFPETGAVCTVTLPAEHLGDE
jgi:two-component system CheB/CheR fusion protein